MLLPWLFVNFSTCKFYTVNAIFHEYDPMATYGYYFRRLPDIVSYPVLLLSCISLIMFIQLWKRVEYRFAVFWAGSALAVLWLYKVNEPRYAIFAVPPLIFLTMQIVSHFTESRSFFRNHKKVVVFALAVLICIHLNPKAVWSGPDVRGFDDLADFIESDAECVSVLYDGYFNANFIFYVRCRDDDRRVFLFRASKLIYASRQIAKWGYHELVKEASEFYDTLNRYSIKYIVQEEKDSYRTPANRRLRQWLRTDRFRIIKDFPMECVGLDDIGRVIVFEYLDYKAEPLKRIELEMPTLGRKIIVDLEHKR